MLHAPRLAANVLYTAASDVAALAAAAAALTRYPGKPFSIDELMELLRQALLERKC